MTSSNRGSPIKRARILTAAATLFAEKGVEGTTLAMIAKASGAAVGSITHYFGDKPRLAAAVHDNLVDRLIAVAEAALGGYGTDPSGAIRTLLSDCLAWVEAFPHDLGLIAALAAYTSKPAQDGMDGMQQRLARVLATWAEPLVHANTVAPLTSTQLYAVILAPAMCAAMPFAGAASNNRESSVGWLPVLAAAAVRAIAPPNRKPNQPLPGGSDVRARQPSSTSPPHGTGQRDLLR